MASTEDYLNFVLDQLSGLEGIEYRPMMGEYLLYCRGKLFGGIYDNRFLVKPVKAAVNILKNAPRERPYEGAGEMLMVEDIENRELLCDLVNAMYDELPVPKKKKRKQ